MNEPIVSLVEERQKAYRDAWSMTGEVLLRTGLHVPLHDLVLTFPQAWYPWIMILNKLIRALWSPRNVDHWRDIAGYAFLVSQFLDKQNAKKNS